MQDSALADAAVRPVRLGARGVAEVARDEAPADRGVVVAARDEGDLEAGEVLGELGADREGAGEGLEVEAVLRSGR